jgi:hypothetical protein
MMEHETAQIIYILVAVILLFGTCVCYVDNLKCKRKWFIGSLIWVFPALVRVFFDVVLS